MAGIIGARDNGLGFIGVAPETGLYAVKVLDSTGSGSWSAVAAGINWAVQNGMFNPAFEPGQLLQAHAASPQARAGRQGFSAAVVAVLDQRMVNVMVAVAAGDRSAEPAEDDADEDREQVAAEGGVGSSR